MLSYIFFTFFDEISKIQWVKLSKVKAEQGLESLNRILGRSSFRTFYML